MVQRPPTHLSSPPDAAIACHTTSIASLSPPLLPFAASVSHVEAGVLCSGARHRLHLRRRTEPQVQACRTCKAACARLIHRTYHRHAAARAPPPASTAYYSLASPPAAMSTGASASIPPPLSPAPISLAAPPAPPAAPPSPPLLHRHPPLLHRHRSSRHVYDSLSRCCPNIRFGRCRHSYRSHTPPHLRPRISASGSPPSTRIRLHCRLSPRPPSRAVHPHPSLLARAAQRIGLRPAFGPS